MGSVDGRPCSHNRHNLFRCHVGKGDVVCRREGKHIALSCHRLCFQQYPWEARRNIVGYISCLRFLDSTVVIYENKCVLIVRVLVARGSLVSRTEVAFRIVAWEINLGRGFLLSSNWVRSGSRTACLSTYCQGLFVRCGETSIQLPLSGLYLL